MYKFIAGNEKIFFRLASACDFRHQSIFINLIKRHRSRARLIMNEKRLFDFFVFRYCQILNKFGKLIALKLRLLL